MAPGGEEVCHQGERGDFLYLVYAGRLVVVREEADGAERVVRHVGRSESFGEIALLGGQPRTATVRALRDSELLRLSREETERLLHRHPSILHDVTRQLCSWLDPDRRLAPEDRSVIIAVLPIQRSPGPSLAAPLARALAALGPTLHVDARACCEQFGPDAHLTPDGSDVHTRMTSWLAELEARHQFLVYEADAEASLWSRRCLRQADRILIAADAQATPHLGWLDDELRIETVGPEPREELVLLHRDAAQRPVGTSRWLALRPFRQHHHLRLSVEADFTRLARLLAGEGVGLVLGGGGARGFAHIGVLRALEEAGVPVDRIGGTSMGAVIACQWARGFGWRELLELNRRGWVQMAPQKVYTLPLISVLSSVKAEKMLTMMYGEDQLEDLWIDCFCVSTNLTRAELNVHRRGPVRFAVGASMTLPGVTAPKLGNDGDLLVDGGVLDNLPIGVMRQSGRGPIIASDVSARIDVRAHPSYREAPSPWSVLRRKLNRLAEPRPFPNILRLVHRAAVMASDIWAKRSKGQIELYLDLPVDDFELFDMEALDQLAEFGYQFTRQALAESGWRPAGAAAPGTGDGGEQDSTGPGP